MASRLVAAFTPKPRALPTPQRAPGLLNIGTRPRKQLNVIPNVASAPFGIQQAVLRQVYASNGIGGVYVQPLQKVVLEYCDLGGSSKGMREALLNRVPRWASAHPGTEIVVQRVAHRHPHLRAYYDNGYKKSVCVRNRSAQDIIKFLEHYRDTAGVAPIKPKKPVLSDAESVRGVWSPFKDPKVRPDRQPQAPKFLYSNNF